jgi:hypothetical protein
VSEKKITLLDAWRECERNIVPTDTDQITRSKMRFLFYTGALEVIDRLVETDKADSVKLSDLLELMHEAQDMANEIARVSRP